MLQSICNLYNYKMLMRFYVGMLQLTQHIQLQNENALMLKGINYKMISNTKWGAQPLLFVQKNPGWQSVLEPKSSRHFVAEI